VRPPLSLCDWLHQTLRQTRDAKGHLRDISKEVAIETEVTRILRDKFSFKFIEIADQTERMGNQGLERALMGTLARCLECKPSDGWLGGYSPKPRIGESGLWLIHHLGAAPLSSAQMDAINAALSHPPSQIG
jgi:hypothetical protein